MYRAYNSSPIRYADYDGKDEVEIRNGTAVFFVDEGFASDVEIYLGEYDAETRLVTFVGLNLHDRPIQIPLADIQYEADRYVTGAPTTHEEWNAFAITYGEKHEYSPSSLHDLREELGVANPTTTALCAEAIIGTEAVAIEAGISTTLTLLGASAAFRATEFVGESLDPLAKKLKFTGTTLRHIKDVNRFVPKYILETAIKYGKKTPDPRGVAGVFRYEVEMWRNKKSTPLRFLFVRATQRYYTSSIMNR